MANLIIDLTYRNLKQKISGVSTYIYKDIGTSNIKLLYSKQNNIQTVKLYDINTSNTDQRAISTSLKNLFAFYPGQQILDPKFGNKLYKFIYQKLTEYVQADIIRTIKQMIEEYQPRITLNKIDIKQNDETLTYNIIIKYTIKALEKVNTLQLNMSSSDGITFG